MKLTSFSFFSLLNVFFFFGIVSVGYCKHPDVETVYVIFKTHLDVGYTDLSSKVTRRYLQRYIPNALELAARFKKEHAPERYVWTTGSWLVWEYLHRADTAAVEKLKKALADGDITYNLMPYTLSSECMSQPLFRASLLAAKRLDQMFGKRTIAAKMTDVPGHTRGVVSPLADAGAVLLHIGVNPASPVPEVPTFCRWRDSHGKEIILMYQDEYGHDQILPDGKTAVSINFTNDNVGPHSYADVKAIFRILKTRYPNAKIIAATLNEVAARLNAIRDQLPVMTSEIGDTWIHGYPSTPQRMTEFRALNRLFDRWVAENRIDLASDRSISFILNLCQISEHTQGVATPLFIKNFDKYDPDPFMTARRQGVFDMAELSWSEKTAYMSTALEYLPDRLRREAEDALAEVAPKKNPADLPAVAESVSVDRPILTVPLFGGDLKITGMTYRCYDNTDLIAFRDRYLRKPTPGFGPEDFGKPGLENSKVVSVRLPARILTRNTRDENRVRETLYTCGFTIPRGVDPRIVTRGMTLKVREEKTKKRAELELTLYGKPAVRYPEAYWFSFDTANVRQLFAEKIGERVDLSDVVVRGSRAEHGIDRYVDLVRQDGTYRIISKDAMVVNLGSDPGLNFTAGPVCLNDGLHFNLCNTIWGTNFSMWNEGTFTYRFVVEKIK